MLLHHKKWNYRSKRAFRFAEIRSDSICVCIWLELCSIGSALKGDIPGRSVRDRHNEEMKVVIVDAFWNELTERSIDFNENTPTVRRERELIFFINYFCTCSLSLSI